MAVCVYLSPNRSDDSVSAWTSPLGDTLMMTLVRELPPNAFRSSSVSLEARYGM